MMQITSDIIYTATATHFDSGDYLSKTGGISASNAKTGLISFWSKFTGGDATTQDILGNPGTDFRLYKTNLNTIRIQSYDAAEAQVCIQMTSDATITADSTWHHIIIAWDTSDAAKCKLAVDGTIGVTINNRVDLNCDYVTSPWDFSSAANPLAADISEFYFGAGQWLDLTTSSNVQRFRSTAGAPVSLGANGSTPTGTQPNIYLANPYNTFQTNLGTGGDFTVTGTLTSATPP